MSAALTAIQQVLVVRLNASVALTTELTGIYDGPPAQADYPHAVIANSAAADWSHKTGAGREVSIGVAIHVAEGATEQLHRLAGLVEADLVAPLPDPDGWQVVTWRFLRSRILREPAGPWSALLDYRARMIATP